MRHLANSEKKEPKSPDSRDILTHFSYFSFILGQKRLFQKVKYSRWGSNSNREDQDEK